MSVNCFNRLVLVSPLRLAMPIAVYLGLALTGSKISDIVTNPRAQLDAQAALREPHGSPFVFSAMDHCAEVEAFGCAIMTSDAEVPPVTGRRITSLEQAGKLAVPQPGDQRTAYRNKMVLAGCDVPSSAPLANLEAFFQTVAQG